MAYGMRIAFTHSARSATRIASGNASSGNRWVTREATSTFLRAIRPRAFRVSVSVAALLGTRESSRVTNSLGSTSSRDPASGTPRRSTVPPERTARTAWAIARIFPVATTAASTPSPPVSFLAAAGTSCVIGSQTGAAPRRRALSARSGLTSLAKSVSVPRSRRSWITRSPIGPVPRMRALLGFVRARSTARIAHARGSMKDARSKSTEGGSRRTPPWSTFHRGTRKDSANPPGSRFVARYCAHIVGLPPVHARHRPHGTWWCGNTRAPSWIPSTPSPTSETIPTASCPITGGAAVYVPRIFSRSDPHSPHARIDTTISPGPASGTGTSSTTRPPVPRRSAAFTARRERGARHKTSALRGPRSRSVSGRIPARAVLCEMSALGPPAPMAEPWIFLLTGGALVLLGFVAAQVFDKLRFPDYFILMSVGLVLGSGLLPLPVDPKESLKTIAPILSAVAIAFILFEGGLVLHVRGLGKVWGAAGAHTVVAMALSIAGVWVAGTVLLGLAPTTSLIMALAFCGPSASIDMSMLSQLKVQERTRFTIVVEGVMGNVVAAVFVLLFINVSGLATDEPSLLLYLGYLGASILLALGVGLAWTHLVGRKPRRFSFMTSVAMAVILYAISQGLLGGNGGIAAFVFGLVLGHRRFLAAPTAAPPGAAGPRGLQEFHSELVFLLRTFFFLYLGIRVTLSAISGTALLGAVAFVAVF